MRPSSITRWGVLLGVVMAVVLASGEALADRATELKAREAFAAGRYEDALGLFAKLYAEKLHPVYLRNIGRCHQKMRQPQKAIDAFRDYIAKTKKMSADERKEIEGYIREMEALRDEQAAAQKPPTSPPPESVPPTPVPAAPPPAYPPSAPPPAVSLTTTAPPPAASPPFYTRWWFWTAVGVVVVGGAVAAIALSGGTDRPPCTAAGGCQ